MRYHTNARMREVPLFGSGTGSNVIGGVAAPGTVGVADVVRTRLQVEQALVGVNYKFNWSGPVVAKY